MNIRNKQFLGYSAAAIGGVCLVAVLFLRPWAPHTSSTVTSANVAQALQSRLSHPARREARPAALYQARGFTTLWFDGDRVSADAQQVLAILASADEEALPAARYRVPAAPGPDASDAAKADFDLALTGAALRYAADLRWGGWRPQQFFQDVSMSTDNDDVAGGLMQAADGGKAAVYLRSLAPQLREYAQLRTALARYRGLAKASAGPTVMVEARPSAQNLAAVKARLQMEGYLGADPQPPAAIIAALKTYQADSAMTPDGKLDERTAAMLNVSPSTRAAQIAVNMERMRWMPHDLGEQYILVNVPDASLAMMSSERPALVSRVVVGAPDKQTPILATKVVAVTINPAWHVPKSIVAKEIQPKLDQDPGYLEAKHMEMKDGEVTQMPGPDNALGSVKFEMPNGFDVYLHDTPSKRAFLSDDRAQSHGCVRVQKIQPLAEQVLGIGDDELQEAIKGGETESRRLKQPIPVYIQYFTAVARDDGRVLFRDDVYGRDARMIEALFPGQARLASSR